MGERSLRKIALALKQQAARSECPNSGLHHAGKNALHFIQRAEFEALDPGDNTIEVVAYNSSNLLASLPARTTVEFHGVADQAKPRLHILAMRSSFIAGPVSVAGT